MGEGRAALSEAWRNLVLAVDKRGLLGSLRYPQEVWRSLVRQRQRRRLEDQDAFDPEIGVDTVGIVPRMALSELDGDSVLYWPSLPRTLKKILDALPIEPSDFIFVDLGSGKGRALMIAAERPYQQVIGVELAGPLHETARRNLERYASRGAPVADIELRHADASTFELPLRPLVIYLFDPFGGRVFERVIRNLERSFQEAPREIWIAYHQPRCRAILDASEVFELHTDTPGMGEPHCWEEYPWALYQSAVLDGVD